MKIPMNPKNLFKSKKSVSRSHSSSSNSSSSKTGHTTPTSVLNDSKKVQYDLLQAFQIIDTDKDGKISRSELESLLLKIGSGSESEINLMLNEIDSKGDGNIDLTEFGLISAGFGQPLSEGELKDAFKFFDNDDDGTITPDELFHVFKAIGDRECTLEDCKRMIRNVDKNGDGFVCFKDFTLMMDMQEQQNNYTATTTV